MNRSIPAIQKNPRTCKAARFKSVAILDEESLLATCAYIEGFGAPRCGAPRCQTLFWRSAVSDFAPRCQTSLRGVRLFAPRCQTSLRGVQTSLRGADFAPRAG